MIPSRQLYSEASATTRLTDRLKDIGLQGMMHLPRVVFCGDQSSGKSSVVERIVGLDLLPKCPTKRPVELRLVHTPGTQQQNLGLIEPYAVFGNALAEKCHNFKEVENKIAELQHPQQDSASAWNSDPIRLSGSLSAKLVHMSECVDITLVDLPGISRISRSSSIEESNVEEMTIGLMARYCRDDDRSLMVCVIPANIDLSTSHVLQLARQWDPKGDRTIGLLTKIDIMDQGTDACQVLENRLIPLKLGYVGVINRSKEDVLNGTTIADCLVSQDSYFRSNPVYMDISRKSLGIKSFTALLAQCLYKCARQSLPLIVREINMGIEAQQAVLNALGPPLPYDMESRVAMMYRLVSQLADRFRKHMKGSLSGTVSLKDQDVQSTQTNYSGGNILKILFRQLYDDQVHSQKSALNEITDQMIDRVIKMHQGDSIPGFPSIYAFMFLASPLIEQLIEPAKNCFAQIYTYMKVMVMELIQRVFHRFPALVDPVADIVQRLFEERRQFTLKIIESNLECQLNYFYTNDIEYERNRTKLIPTAQRDSTVPEDQKKKPADEREKLRKQRLFVTEVRLRVQAYYKLVLRNLREIIPKNIGHLFNQHLQDNLALHLYQGLLARPEMFELLGEHPRIAQERKAAEHQLDVLKRALYSLKQSGKEEPSGN